MANLKNSKIGHGLQKRLFDKRGYYRKVYRKICAELKASELEIQDIDLVLAEVSSGKIKLNNLQLENDIRLLFKLSQDIKGLEQRIESLEQNSNDSRAKELS